MTSAGSAHIGAFEGAASANRVSLALPGRPELLFLARMTAAAVASRADFGLDQIEDLHLALDELCLTLLPENSEKGRLELQFRWSENEIEVEAEFCEDLRPGTEQVPKLVVASEPNELSERILDALVDEHGFDNREGRTVSWLRMQKREEDA